MGLMDRVRNIILTPTTEWPVIAAETPTKGSLITGYVIPLAAIGAIAGFIGGSLVGHSVPFVGTYRVPIASGLATALFVVGMAVVSVFLLSLIINALAPKFGGEQNSAQAFKVAVYSFTPAWVAGVLQIIPALGILGIFAALYALYVLYLGLPRLMKAPQDKAGAYTAVVAVCAIAIMFVIGITAAAVGGIGMMGAGIAGGAVGAGTLRRTCNSTATAPWASCRSSGRGWKRAAARWRLPRNRATRRHRSPPRWKALARCSAAASASTRSESSSSRRSCRKHLRVFPDKAAAPRNQELRG